MWFNSLIPGDRSLARRLLVGAAIWSLLVLFGGAFALSALYRAEAVRLLEDELNATLVALTRAVDLDEHGDLAANPARLPADPRYDTPLAGRYWAIVEVSSAGAPIDVIHADSLQFGELPLPVPLAEAALAVPGEVQFADTTGPNDERVRVAVMAILLSDAGQRAVVMAAADRATSDAGARRFLFSIIGAMVFLAGGVLVAMVILVRVVLGPLERIQAHLAEIRTGDRAQLDEDYPAEVQPLTAELNQLLEHNREVVDRARTHVGNLAHALKTPIAVLRNEASGETPLDDVVRRQAEAMHNNVQHYLKRAQAAARAQTLGARTEIDEIASGLVRLLNKLFQHQGVTVSSKLPEGLVFRGEAQDLEEMIGNLLENACKWASSEVHLAGEQVSPEWLRLTVDDDGDGLPEEAMKAAVKRGVRLDETAPGTGLGLSIVNELAELYGGELTLSRSEMGGLRAALKLPSL
ncbi:MAG: ATP-binding protein [Hyphomonadaceae bacterium]|nr:ATP-binding protein [Hyphomonadaceae bacterium]